MLEDNRHRIQKLSGLEIWMFIVGRFLLGIGVGIVAVHYYPFVANLGWPLLGVGLVMTLYASLGLQR